MEEGGWFIPTIFGLVVVIAGGASFLWRAFA